MNSVVFRLYPYAQDFLRARLSNMIPSRTHALTKHRRFAAQMVLTRLGNSYTRVTWHMPIYAGAAGDVAPVWVDAEMSIHTYTEPRVVSNIGEIFAGSSIESRPGGETRATLVVKQFQAAGTSVQITDADENVLFSGSVVQATYNAETGLWSLTATDDVTAQGLDSEIEMGSYTDIVDAIPVEIDDMSQVTQFPTIPVEGITLRTWITMLEALRGARLFYDPGTQRYTLTDKIRIWNLADALSFTENIDASQYFNVIIVEQDDAWEQAAERKTTTSTYDAYTLVTDRAGEKIFSAQLSGPAGLVVKNTFEYNDLHQIIKTTAVQGVQTTTTTYVIQQGANPYIRSELMITTSPTQPTAFLERRHTTTSLSFNTDGTMLVVTKEIREWFELEKVVTYE